MGTPNYMSPEQAKGLKVDARADVFSLGCVLYECLSGTKPFHDDSVTAILLKVVVEPAPPIDFEALGLPGAVDGVLRKAMAKEPGRRFESPAALMEAARQAASGVELTPPAGGRSGTVVATPAAKPVPVPTGSGALSSAPMEPSPFGAVTKRLSGPRAALALAVVAGGVLAVVGLRLLDPASSPVANGRLVAEEELSPIGRLFGRAPRLLITVPGKTTLSVEMRTTVDSATARPGDAITAAVVERVLIEGQEAVGPGAQVHGRVTGVTSAAEAVGRGRLTLGFDLVVLTDGTRVRIDSDPVELTAPRPRSTTSRKRGLAGAWAQVTATVGDIVREAKGDGRSSGRIAGAHAVQGGGGVDIEVPAGATLDVELAGPVTIARTRVP